MLAWTWVGRCEASYHTLAGSVSIERSLYRQSGQRGGEPGGKVVDPVSLRVGVVGDGWLPRTARTMAHTVQQGTSREAEATAGEFGRLPYSRSSFERVAHLVGALAVADRQDIEDVLIDAYEVPAKVRSISVSLDRVSVPMEEPRPRPVGRPRKGAPKRPVERNFRMAYCGTVTLHDENGAAPAPGAGPPRVRIFISRRAPACEEPTPARAATREEYGLWARLRPGAGAGLDAIIVS